MLTRDFPRAGPLYFTVFVVALANRLIPVLRGGGLSGVLGYDDGVYYGGAVALVHGRLPYRDFLLLHPPGVLLALAPVAGLGRWAGEVAGWEASRLGWMLMGCGTSLVIVKILRPLGNWPALAAGLAYAMFPGAVLVERTTLLEGLANLCLAGALALVARDFESARQRLSGATGSGRRWIVAAAAGGLLGFAAAVKIWGVVPLAVVGGFAVVAAGWRCAAAIVAGSGVVIGAVCLPFVLAAPSAMWRMVVLDQIGRDREGDAGVLRRLADIATMDRAPSGAIGLAVGLVIIVAVVAICVMAWPVRRIRIAVPILLTTIILLLASPTFFPHYVGVLAVPGALVVGGAVDRFRRWTASPDVPRIAFVVAAGIVVVLELVSLAVIRSGVAVPTAKLATPVRPASGCITADDPNVLLALGVVGRNARRGCEVVIDLGGYSHDLSRGTAVPRRRNLEWQQFVVRYLGSGELALVSRFGEDSGFNASTAKEVRSWPVLIHEGGYAVRRPRR